MWKSNLWFWFLRWLYNHVLKLCRVWSNLSVVIRDVRLQRSHRIRSRRLVRCRTARVSSIEQFASIRATVTGSSSRWPLFTQFHERFHAFQRWTFTAKNITFFRPASTLINNKPKLTNQLNRCRKLSKYLIDLLN